uniref:Uncharacterized protein n=1 Tax=Equus asinus TaxID=9793 RepID=A0A9L0JU68_EQUAS
MAIAISVGLVAGTNILASTVLTLMVPWHSLDPDWALADAFYQRGYSWAGFIVAAGAVCGKRPFWVRWERTGWWGPAHSLPRRHLHLGLCSQLCPGPRKVLVIRLATTQAFWEGPAHHPSQSYTECQFWACAARYFPGGRTQPSSDSPVGLSPELGCPIPGWWGGTVQYPTYTQAHSESPDKLMPLLARGHPCSGPDQRPQVGLSTMLTGLPPSAIGMTTVLFNILFAVPCIVYAMATDGLFFQIFTHVHPRTQVPIVGILVFGFLMPLLAVLLDLEALIQFLSIGTLVTCPVVNTSIIVLRFQKSPPSSPLGSVSPGPVAEGYEDSSGHRRLEDTEQPSAPEPGQLRPALRPFLGFMSGCRPGVAVAWSPRVLVVSAIILDCVLVFGNSALHLPPWGHTLLLLLSSVVFLLSLLVLGAQQQQRREDAFQVEKVSVDSQEIRPWPSSPALAPSGSHGAPDSSREHPPQHLPHAAAELPDLAALLRLAADWPCYVYHRRLQLPVPACEDYTGSCWLWKLYSSTLCSLDISFLWAPKTTRHTSSRSNNQASAL